MPLMFSDCSLVSGPLGVLQSDTIFIHICFYSKFLAAPFSYLEKPLISIFPCFMCSSFSFSVLSHNLALLPPTSLSEIAVSTILQVGMPSWSAFHLIQKIWQEDGNTHTLFHPLRALFPWRWFFTHMRDLDVKNRIPSNPPSCTPFREFLAQKIDRVLIKTTDQP